MFKENKDYRLSGVIFCENTLAKNDGVFKFIRIEDDMYRFEGKTSGDPQWIRKEDLEHKSAVVREVRRPKGKKGPARKAPTVDKVIVYFDSGSSYTVKNFLAINMDQDFIQFIKETESHGTVLTEKTVTIPLFDVVALEVRGVERQFAVHFLADSDDVMLIENGSMIISSNFEISI